MKKGYVHVYTGNGKGKTTAALGVAVRKLCVGDKVFFGQFIKGMKYSETLLSEKVDGILFRQYGEDCFIDKSPTEKDKERAKEGLEDCIKIINSCEYELVVLDEIFIALYFKLIEIEDVENIIKNKPEEVELILTGRYCPNEIMEIADLVTEMKEIKHYYNKGVLSRSGIDC
jgi:cob(I)alamin adenosyltransferase